jgi:hypothetical protein
MLKFGFNFIRKLSYIRNRRKIRVDSHWTDSNPSPESSWLRKKANRTGEWIFYHIDYFFQGHTNKYNAELNSYFSNQKNISASQVEWELNQDVVDIAFKDIKSGLSSILPIFLRRFITRLYQLSLLYLFTDVVYEEESPEWSELGDNHCDLIIMDRSKVLNILPCFEEKINSNCLSINHWLKKFKYGLRVFLRPEQEKKTYYLLGHFALREYDNSVTNQNHMIRGPDSAKLYPAFSYRKRI